MGLGRLGIIAAFGRKEIENFNFVPSLGGNYQETLQVNNVLDSFNDQTIAIKAMVRKMPALSVEPAAITFGRVDVSAKSPESKSLIVTNISKIERTFVVEVQPSATEAFALVSLSQDDQGGGTALSRGEEEEVETLLQKLKIANRKGKKDKITKYETRLAELGISTPKSDTAPSSAAKATTSTAEITGSESEIPSEAVSGTATPAEIDLNADHDMSIAGQSCTTSLTMTLLPNGKSKLLVDLLPNPNRRSSLALLLDTIIKVYDRKNTDETITVSITASQFIKQASETSNSITAQSSKSTDSPHQNPLHLSIMRHCLTLTLSCPVSQTAFCVGSSLFLPDTSPLFTWLKPHFPTFPADDQDPAGLLLDDGYSRQIPGNTHAEANALTNFRARYSELVKATLNSPKMKRAHPSTSSEGGGPTETSSNTSDMEASQPLPPIEEVLAESSCYATMEPCSYRTSGGPSCALELVKAKVKTVYLGVEEPPDFVQCEGVRILQDGGVEVVRLVGLEAECLKAARRGRN